MDIVAAFAGHVQDGHPHNGGDLYRLGIELKILCVVVAHENLQTVEFFFLGKELDGSVSDDAFIAHGTAHALFIENEVISLKSVISRSFLRIKRIPPEGI